MGIFDHLPSKTVSTRYLHVDKTSLHASSDQWEAFKIHLGIIDRLELEEREDLTLSFSLSLKSMKMKAKSPLSMESFTTVKR